MKKLLEIFELLVMFTVLSSAAYAVEEVSVEEAQQQSGEVLEEIQLEHPKLHFTHHYREADGTKKLHSAPAETSQELGGFDVVKYIKLTIIRGNWALVSVIDMANVPKTGFVKWRNADGQLYMFPCFR